MKNSLFLFLLVIAACLLFEYFDSPLAPRKPVTLTMWHVYGSQTGSPMNDLVERFNRTVGKEQGITVNVTSVSNSSAIHDALIDSARRVPGSGELPDLFTCYPKTLLAMGSDLVMDWNGWFSEAERGEYVPRFLEEGRIDGKQLAFPIAKSTDVLFVNATIFDRFAGDTGGSYEDLASWEGFFRVSRLYHAWSGGKPFFMYSSWLHYAMLNTASFGESLFRDGKINWGDTFRRVWEPLAEAGVAGEICLLKGYATTAMMTGAVVCGLESTASIMYYKDTVTFPDNTSLPLRLKVLPMPVFEDGKPFAVQRGVSLCALRSTPEKEQAAYVFCKWITEEETNLGFVISAGYLPVKTEAYQRLLDGKRPAFPDESYRSLYEAVGVLHAGYTFFIPPLFDEYGSTEKAFSASLRSIFAEGRARREREGAVFSAPAAWSLAAMRERVQ